MERTQPAPSKEQIEARKRAETVAEWYAEDALRTVATFLGTPRVGLLATGFVKPTPTARVLAWVSRDSHGNVEPYGIGAAVDAIVGEGQPGSSKYRGLCLVHIRSVQEVQAAVGVNSPVAAELKGIAVVQATDPHSWNELEHAVQGMASDRWALAVQATEDVHHRLGLLGKSKVFDSKDVVAIPRRGIPACFQALAHLVRSPSSAYQVVIALTSVPETWFRSWVWEEKKQEIREFIDGALDAVDLSKSQMPTDTRESIARVHELWQLVRTEVKDRLEQIIKAMSQQQYETFEEKAEAAARLNELLDAWRFRAVSPSSGRASYFQCRVGERNPRGYFFFQDVDADSVPVTAPDPGAPRAPGQVPTFALTDFPPNPRHRPPDHKPAARAPRK